MLQFYKLVGNRRRQIAVEQREMDTSLVVDLERQYGYTVDVQLSERATFEQYDLVRITTAAWRC